MLKETKKNNYIYGGMILFCLFPFLKPAMALGLGLLVALLGFKHKSVSKYTSLALQISIVLMGFGMNLAQVMNASKTGLIETATSVTVVMLFGLALGKLLKVDEKITLLISAGTAICGGSAIAAVSPVIKAKNYQISFALIVVFILNAIALIVFPIIGHSLNMSQTVFGNWAAIAIHDTSSVVGASATYGKEALEIATTVKLIRALWIIPLTLVISFFQKNNSKEKIKVPWFIGYFVIAIVVAYFLPALKNIFNTLHWLGQRGMVIALFLIGSSISIADIKRAGFKSFLLGILIWLFIGGGTLFLFK